MRKCHCGEYVKRQLVIQVEAHENPSLVTNYCAYCCLVRCDAFPGECE